MNLIVNSDGYRIGGIDGEILSTNGRVKILDVEIPPYPKLLHLPKIEGKMIAQVKIHGYNVRLSYIPKLENFIAVLRGGYVCAKTTFLLREHFSDLFMKFFKENPKKILCIEVVGRKSLANVHSDYFKEKYDFDEIGYFVFDIMDLEKSEGDRFLGFEDLEGMCKKYNLGIIPVEGVFEDINDLNNAMQKIPDVFEGVVVKSLDGREIMKYRFDDKPDLFGDKIPKREKRIMPPEESILAHFFQGYEEQELGLESGIFPEEMNDYGKRIDGMKDVILKDKSKIGEESDKIVDFLMDTIKTHGRFDDDILKKIEKLFKNKIGGEVGKILRLERR